MGHSQMLCPVHSLCPELPFLCAESTVWGMFSSVNSQSLVLPQDLLSDAHAFLGVSRCPCPLRGPHYPAFLSFLKKDYLFNRDREHEQA